MEESIFRLAWTRADSRLNLEGETKRDQLMTIVCKADGLCEPAFEGGPQNPGGVATYGYFICYEDGRPITKGSGVVGEGEGMDHVVAEYEAVVQALRYLLHERKTSEPVEVRNDNQQLVLEMNGLKEVGKGPYVSRYDEARKLSSQFPRIHFGPIDRELDWEADCLAWKEYRRYLSERRGLI